MSEEDYTFLACDEEITKIKNNLVENEWRPTKVKMSPPGGM